MDYPKHLTTKKTCVLLLAVATWLTLALQLYLTEGSIINFFSYFTILCNLLVAVSLTFSSLWPASKTGVYFSGVSVQSAIALYMFIVGLVYNLVLRGVWEPTGWQLLADNMLHVVIPVSYILYWFIFNPKGVLKWREGIFWAIFPFAYLAYSLIRGTFVHWYPYPFLNVTQFGYKQVFSNIGAMITVFLLVGLLFIALNRSMKKKENT